MYYAFHVGLIKKENHRKLYFKKTQGTRTAIIRELRALEPICKEHMMKRTAIIRDDMFLQHNFKDRRTLEHNLQGPDNSRTPWPLKKIFEE